MPVDYKLAIDSLNKANAELAGRQKQLDSAITYYQAQIEAIEYAIGDIQTEKTEVHNHYTNMSNQAASYTPTQIDSFFKARYDY